MQKKLIAVLLVFAVAFVSIAPPRVFAQTREDSASVDEPAPAAAPTAKSDLRKSLSLLTNTKAGPLTAADLKRIQQQQDNQQPSDQPKPGWSTKKKLLVALLVVVATGAFIVAYKHRCRDTPEKPCPEFDTTDYDY